MKMNQVHFRHGDLLMVQVSAIPTTAKKVAHGILAEGEVTGHAHRLQHGVVFQDGDRLYFESDGTAVVTHEEHATIAFPAGVYEVIRQREYNPFEDAARRVAD